MTEPRTTPISSFPVSLDLTDRPCLVVGAGAVAARKARSLLDAGATVTVVAPAVGAAMAALAPELSGLERRPFLPGDVAGFRLVITATGDPEVDGAVAAEAEVAGIWVNSADDPSHCSFILPAVHRDGAVTIAVSTGGLSPALAVWLRDHIAASNGEGLDALARLLDEARRQVQAEGRASASIDWTALLDSELPDLVRAGDLDNARAILNRATSR